MLRELRQVAQRIVQIPPAIWIAQATHSSNGTETFMWGVFTQTSYTVGEYAIGIHAENKYRVLSSRIIEYLKTTNNEKNFHIMCSPPDLIGNIICLDGSLILLEPLSDTAKTEFWQALRNQYRIAFPLLQAQQGA